MAATRAGVKRIAFGIRLPRLPSPALLDHYPAGRAVDRPRDIGRIFAICVLGGMTSLPGMLAAAMLIGIVESITATFYGPSWAPAVAFGFLLLTLLCARRHPGALAMGSSGSETFTAPLPHRGRGCLAQRGG